MRAALALTALLAFGSFACSAMMGDLSQSEGDGDPRATGGANGGQAGGDDPMLQASNGAATNSSSLQSNPDASSPNQNTDGGMLTPTPAPKPARTCGAVALRPTTAFNAGGGQSWRAPTQALVGDGNPATTPLSTDNRESTYLQLGGFGGATIPANAVITGFRLDVNRSASSNCITSQEVTAIVSGAARSRPDVGERWRTPPLTEGPTISGAAAPSRRRRSRTDPSPCE